MLSTKYIEAVLLSVERDLYIGAGSQAVRYAREEFEAIKNREDPDNNHNSED